MTAISQGDLHGHLERKGDVAGWKQVRSGLCHIGFLCNGLSNGHKGKGRRCLEGIHHRLRGPRQGCDGWGK